MSILSKIGPAAVLFLVAARRGSKGKVRRHAARALWDIGSPAVPLLIQALSDLDSEVRQLAIEALGAIKPAGAEAVPLLAKALGDADVRVRGSAAEALANWAPAAAAAGPLLIAALSDADSEVHWNAVYALGKIGSPALPLLINAFRRASTFR